MQIATHTLRSIDTGAEDRTQLIRDRVRDAIVDRRLAPSTKLSELELGALFDVGRTSVRSALQMLAFEGLVRIERNRGAFVSDPSPQEARQIFVSRRLIEPGVVSLAIQQLKPTHLAALRKHLDQERHFTAGRDVPARRAEIKSSGDFHLMLADVAGNAILKRFMDELIARSSLVIALYGRSGASSCGHEDHAAIIDALRRRDEKAASRVMLRHIDHVEADLDLNPKKGLPLRDALLVSS